MNSIELTKSQIKAYENGATIVMIPLSIPAGYEYQGLSAKDDKDIFVKEEFWEHETRTVFYKAENENIRNDKYWLSASEMTKEQSRYLFSELLDIKIARVQEININLRGLCLYSEEDTGEYCYEDSYGLGLEFVDFYNQQMQEQNIAKTYDDNDYVFLVQFKR